MSAKKGEIKMIKKFFAEGLNKSAIARKLGISGDTVRCYANLPDDYIPHIAKMLEMAEQQRAKYH